MAVINQLTEVTHVVIRAVAPEEASTTSSHASAQTTSDRDDINDNNNNGSSSPFLFFIALGFGVVFTNFWIIVGVKRCLRYNARNRRIRMNEDGEPITLENMPRRRREKKLMTMDEVNEKFPMMKYKTWASDRAKKGLPSTGGVSAPPTRPNSVRDVHGIVPDFSAKDHDSTYGRLSAVASKNQGETTEATNTTETPAPATTAATTEAEKPKDASSTPAETGQTSGLQSTNNNQLQRVSSEDTDDEDDHIDGALPPECLEAPGDTCAICIDTLEEDDDVRGLTCGHAFHTVCVDPWLTSRRACCPLCKADYYVPKPRPAPEANEAAAANNANFNARNNSLLNMPAGLRSGWLRGSRGASSNMYRQGETPRQRRAARRAEEEAATQGGQDAQQTQQTQQISEVTHASDGGILSSVRGVFRFGRRRQDQHTGQNGSAPETVTSSQLEAANRPPVAAQ